MVPLIFPILVCFLWTNGIFGYSARGTKVHLYWFWWQSWPSVWVYTYVCMSYFYIHVVSTPMQHVWCPLCVSCASSLVLSLSSFPLLPSPPSHLSLPFLSHTSLHSYLSPMVFVDSGPSDSQYPKSLFVQTSGII